MGVLSAGWAATMPSGVRVSVYGGSSSVCMPSCYARALLPCFDICYRLAESDMNNSCTQRIHAGTVSDMRCTVRRKESKHDVLCIARRSRPRSGNGPR
jgi:hypothetical protein